MLSRLLIALVLVLPTVAAGDDSDAIHDQKDELRNIKQSLDQGRQVLDSLKQEEVKVQKQIGDIDQKLDANTQSISQLGRQLSGVRNQITGAEDRLATDQEKYERSRRRFLGNIRQFYMTARTPSVLLSDRPDHELDLNRKVIYLTAAAAYESGAVSQASALLGESIENLEQLSGEKQRVSKLKKKTETAAALDKTKIAHQQKELSRLHRKRTEETDRILMLEQAAQEMEMIVARLEQQRQAAATTPGQPKPPSVFASLQGHLLAPYDGKIVIRFGSSKDPITALKSFSPGVSIKGRAGRPVTAVATGVVSYVGELRGYGNFIILDHGDQYYTTYAGLGEISVTKGMLVSSAHELGKAGGDATVRFELRKGRRPLDPLEWIKSDAY